MTAEECLKKNFCYPDQAKNIIPRDGIPFSNFERIEKSMIEFAQHHVEEALKAASENARVKYPLRDDNDVFKPSILNAYPLSNIK